MSYEGELLLEPRAEPNVAGKTRALPCWAVEVSGTVQSVDLKNLRFTVEDDAGAETTVYIGKRRANTLIFLDGRGAGGPALKPGRRVRAYEDSCTRPGYAYRIDAEAAPRRD